MKRLSFATTVMALAAIGVAVAAPQEARAQYAIDYLISPYQPNIVDSWLFGINNKGQSTGYEVQKDVDGHYKQSTVIYQNGNSQRLDANSPGGVYYGTSGLAINDRGDVAGNSGRLPTFFAASGGATPINTPGLDYNQIYGINNAGTVLVNGFSQDAATGYQENFQLWNNGTSRSLDVLNALYPYILPPDPNDFNSGFSAFSYSNSVTNLANGDHFAAGVDYSTYDPKDPNNPDDDVTTDSYSAFVFDGVDNYHMLTPLTAGDVIRPINTLDDGSVFGWEGSQLARWNPDGTLNQILPDYSGGLIGSEYYSTVQMNRLGQIVAITSAHGIAFYDPLTGTWSDISASISGLGTGTFSTIQGYNDMGQFVGLVRPPTGGGVFGYVVTAVPEPGSLALLVSMAGAGLLLRKRRLK